MESTKPFSAKISSEAQVPQVGTKTTYLVEISNAKFSGEVKVHFYDFSKLYCFLKFKD